MTRQKIREYSRFLIDEHGLNWLEEKNADKFTLDDCIDKAYIDVAEETKCFHSDGYTLASVASQAVYSYSDFGEYSVWTVNTVKAVGDIVVPVTANGHKYICTAVTGDFKTHAATEPVWTKVVNGTQPTDDMVTWKEHGTDNSAGSRIFEPKIIAYDSNVLKAVNEDFLAKQNANWQFADASTPNYWTQFGIDKFKLYPKPSGTDNIYIEGYEYPDLGAFDADDDESLLGSNHDDVIAIGAAIMVTVSDPMDANERRQSILYPMYQNGVAAIKARAFAANKQDTIINRYRGEYTSRFWHVDDSALI